MGFTNKQGDGDKKERVKIKAVTLPVVDCMTLTKMREGKTSNFFAVRRPQIGRQCRLRLGSIRTIRNVIEGKSLPL